MGASGRYWRALTNQKIDPRVAVARLDDLVAPCIGDLGDINGNTAFRQRHELGANAEFEPLALGRATPLPIDQTAKIAAKWTPWRGVAARLFWAYYRICRAKTALPV